MKRARHLASDVEESIMRDAFSSLQRSLLEFYGLAHPISLLPLSFTPSLTSGRVHTARISACQKRTTSRRLLFSPPIPAPLPWSPPPSARPTFLSSALPFSAPPPAPLPRATQTNSRRTKRQPLHRIHLLQLPLRLQLGRPALLQREAMAGSWCAAARGVED
ncbi:hypothetical protein B0H34DRAFT_734426 [Crassisporium funariophilum]|nr:hypothetical protein B0H34DRAFT_734374 [Crassisporium funariophilum]KAF8149583.1 hypothetical protein B0H34DRAFT_734426 [Crassisporium funariophilum]